MASAGPTSSPSPQQSTSQKQTHKKKPAPQRNDPVLEHRIAEAKRLEELVRTPTRVISSEYLDAINEVREVTGTQLSNEEILQELQAKSFDVNAVVFAISDSNADAGWKNAKSKRSKKAGTPPQQPQQQPQPQPQPQPQTQPQRPKQKQQAAPVAHPVSVVTPVAPQDLILEMGRTLSQQLAEVEQHAKLLLELKTEYDSVLTQTSQDIANLTTRKAKLEHEKGELERQVTSVTQQIEEVTAKIASMEIEHVEKLKVLKEKSKLTGVMPNASQR